MKTPRARPSAAPLPASFLAMMARGVSCIVSSCGATGRPSIMRAMGSSIAADGGKVTVFLSRRQSPQLLRDIEESGRLAVVFSEPASHHTVQLKASRVRMRDARPSDAPALQRYLASMEHELGRIGITLPLTRAMLAHRLQDLVALSFVPEQAFDQTPGPKAGAALDVTDGAQAS